MSLFDGPDYDSSSVFAGDGLGVAYSNWDRNSIQLCECDDGYFTSDCSQSESISAVLSSVLCRHFSHLLSAVMCPKGDDPLTINQNYRALRINVIAGGYVPLAGKLGLTFLGATTFLELEYLSSQTCTDTLAFSGRFANLLCTVTALNGNFEYRLDVTFYSWPTYPKESNLYSNDGNPSRLDFYCDATFSAHTYCTFSDLQADNIRGARMLSLVFLS